MKLFDLHCDTLTELRKINEDLYSTKTQLSLNYLKAFDQWCQTFAIFVPDNVRGVEAEEYFHVHQQYFCKLMEKHSDAIEMVNSSKDIETITQKGKCAAILSIEGGACINGKLENIPMLAEKGVKMLTLVWNGENEIASGHNTTKGITAFGREAIQVMEGSGIIVDVSHLNDKGFEDLTGIAKKPFIATHSNSRPICSHRRNLTDEQFLYIVEHHGLVGLNLFEDFISDAPHMGTPENLMKHVYHLLEIGGENTLCCGSDFDGADIHLTLNNPEKFGNFGEYMLRCGISKKVVDKIMFQNALDFFQENLK